MFSPYLKRVLVSVIGTMTSSPRLFDVLILTKSSDSMGLNGSIRAYRNAGIVA
jgi:hypothetical protein